eukprot:jgi/Botrbrau1/8016/Bobra.384_2s0038.1
MMKAASRLKPIAPRPPEVGSQGANPNAFAGYHLGVHASPLEGSVSMNPRDYVWGTPTVLPGAPAYGQFAASGYLGPAGNVPYSQPPLHHSLSLPNLYPPGGLHQGGKVVPLQPIPQPVPPMPHTGSDVPAHAEAQIEKLNLQSDFPMKALDELDVDMLGNLELDILDDNLVEGAMTCENVLSRADSWKVGSDLPSDISTATGDKSLGHLNLLGDDSKEDLHVTTGSANILDPAEVPEGGPTLSLPLNLDFLDGLEDLEDTSSQLVPLPTADTAIVTAEKVVPGLKRAKSEIVLKKTARSPNLLRRLPPQEAFTTILDFLNTEDRVPRNERDAAIFAIRALQQSLDKHEASIYSRESSSKPSPVLGLLRTRSDKIPKGKRSRNSRAASPSKTHLAPLLPIDLH